MGPMQYFYKENFWVKEMSSLFPHRSRRIIYKEPATRETMDGRVTFNINDAPRMHTEAGEFQKPPIDTH